MMNRRAWARINGLIVLLVMAGFSAPSTWAQNYAAPSGQPYAGDGTCSNPSNPCTLAAAVVDATDGGSSGTTVYALLAGSGATTAFQGDLVGAARIDVDMTLNTYTMPGVVTGVPGYIALGGDVTITANRTLTIVAGVTFQLEGQPGRIELHDNVQVAGPGVLMFAANMGSYDIQLGDPSVGCPGASPKTASIENMSVNKINGVVNVLDQCPLDDESDLYITNRLDVQNGTLDMGDNNLWAVPGISAPDPGMTVAAGGTIAGGGYLFIAPPAAASGGPPNTLAGAYRIEGGGTLAMAFDKTTDAGVEIAVPMVGTGALLLNRAGVLYITQAATLNGTLRNEGAARTEFWVVDRLTYSLEVMGPGGEVFPSDGTCGTGNESGVYLFDGITIEGDLITNNTDDPSTAGCVEGVSFMGDATPGSVAPPVQASGSTVVSTVEGTYYADGAAGVMLHSDDFIHNVAFKGHWTFDEAPTFTMAAPADAYPVGDLCAGYAIEAEGNKVIFAGAADQTLSYTTPLVVPSVQIYKDATGQDVEIDATAAALRIGTSLEIFRGQFITNELLDANAGTAFDEGATVVVNRDAAGHGVLYRGDADRAYVSDAAATIPRKVRYVGATPRFTGDEIPGPSSGSIGGPEIFLSELEIFLSDASSVVTVAKDFTLIDQLDVIQGLLDAGSAKLKLENNLLGVVGNGQIVGPEWPGSRGELIFPSEHMAGFTPGIDGIDLFYAGTMDVTVDFLWPPSATTVANRKVDADVIRNVRIDPACGDDITVSLRDADDAFRINGDVIIGAQEGGQGTATGTNVGALDVIGNVLEINAVNGVDNVVEVHGDADLCDSADGLSCNQSASVTSPLLALADDVSAALAAYRHAQNEETQNRLTAALAALRAAQAADHDPAQAHAGLLRFIGEDDTDVWIETSSNRLRFDFPALEVDRGPGGHVTFDAEGVLSTTPPGLPANNPDVLGTPHFTFTNGAIGDEDLPTGDAGGVQLLNGLDVLDIGGQYAQFGGEFLMEGLSSIGPAPTNWYVQTVRVGFTRVPGDMVLNDGEFFVTGGNVEAFANYRQGTNLGQDPGDALFSLLSNGTHFVVGDFRVGPDTDPAEHPDQQIPERNRYFLGGECGLQPDRGGLFVNGSYVFEGTGDRFNDNMWPPSMQGLQGNVFFTGAVAQDVQHRPDEDAYFCDVVIASRGSANDGITLGSDVFQNDAATLTFSYGIIDTDNEQFTWGVLNQDFETNLVDRNNASQGEGVMELGSDASYVDGTVHRIVRKKTKTDGVLTGGYLFPVGTADYFRPLILHFDTKPGIERLASVDYRQDLTNQDVVFSPIIVPGFDEAAGLMLDVIGNQFWQLEFDAIPSVDPHIRLEPDGLRNVFDILQLRIIQWDCDGTNPRLAGYFDPTGGPVGTAARTTIITGVPNVTHEAVDVETCQLLGIASNKALNPIASVFNAVPMAFNVQLEPGAVTTQTLRIINADVFNPHDFILVVSADPDDYLSISLPTSLSENAAPGDTIIMPLPPGGFQDIDVTFDAGVLPLGNYVAMMTLNEVGGGPATTFDISADLAVALPGVFTITLKKLVRSVTGTKKAKITWDPATINKGKLDFYVDEVPDGSYIKRTPNDGGQKIKLPTAQFPGDGPFTIQACEKNSTTVCSNVLTADFAGVPIDLNEPDDDDDEGAASKVGAAAGVPEMFALQGNYPNPFNPVTVIAVDLPETAEVGVRVYDLLGREVLALPLRVIEAGARRQVEVDGRRLASGTYVYRLTARTADDVHVATGRMVLVK